MKAIDKIQKIYDFTEKDLLQNVLPFWMKFVPDNEYGGFYGRISNDQVVDKRAEKGAILNARILYTFSSAYRIYGDNQYKIIADRAFNYIKNHFIDPVNGGVYWSLDYKGNPLDTKKQFYALAFVVYALAEYYKSTKNKKALQEALAIYSMIELYAFDPVQNGYIEALSREWKPMKDMRLSARDMNVMKSMNTHLHIIEAYTNLYRIHKDKNLHNQLINLYDVFRNHIVDSNTNHLILFFDNEWTRMSEIISFGHDIEASWLLLEAAEVAEDHERIKDAGQLSVRIVDSVYEGIDNEGGLCYEYEPGRGLLSDREWWPQAEAVVGFLNAFQLTGNEKYLDSANKSCEIINKYLIDHTNGEWFFRVDQLGKPRLNEDKVGFWKCPYHNSRMAFEVKERRAKMMNSNSIS